MNRDFLTTINKALAFIGSKFDKLERSQEDYTRKLVNEIRDSGKTIQLDLTTRAIEKLQETSDLNINKVSKSLEIIAKEEGVRLQNLTKVIAQLEQAVRDETSDTQILKNIAESLKQLVAEETKPEDASMHKEMCARLDAIVNAVKEIEFEESETDLEPVLDGLSEMKMLLRAILSAIQNNKPEKLAEKFDAMDAVFKGLKPKDSVRFADDQMKNLMAALTNGSGGGFTTVPGVKSASNWEVDRVALTAANTQYSYTFPSNTVSWTFKLRTPGATLFYSSVTGKLPVSGDNTTYMTMLPMGARSQDGMEWGGTTMYFETDTATQVVEIEIFTM